MMSGESERQQPLDVNQCKEIIHDKLILTGQGDLLKQLIRTRLAETGWTSSMRAEHMEYVKNKGVANVNVAHMIDGTVPLGIKTFPEAVRNEIADILLKFSTQYIRTDDSVQRLPESDHACATAELFQYQSKDSKPDPGLSINVVMPQLNINSTPSPITVSRLLTPPPSLPVLCPETFEAGIKEVPTPEENEGEEEEEILRNDKEESEELMDF